MTIKIVKCNNIKDYPARIENYVKAADNIYVDTAHPPEEIVARFIAFKNKVPLPNLFRLTLDSVPQFYDPRIIIDTNILIHRIVDKSYSDYKIKVDVYNNKYSVIGDASEILNNLNKYNIIVFIINNRFEFKVKLGNIFRVIKFMLLIGHLDLKQLIITADKFGNKFTSNFIKLLNDKTKSKRFVVEILPRHSNITFKGKKGFALSSYSENGLTANIYEKVKKTTFTVNNGINNIKDIQKEV